MPMTWLRAREGVCVRMALAMKGLGRTMLRMGMGQNLGRMGLGMMGSSKTALKMVRGFLCGLMAPSLLELLRIT